MKELNSHHLQAFHWKKHGGHGQEIPHAELSESHLEDTAHLPESQYCRKSTTNHQIIYTKDIVRRGLLQYYISLDSNNLHTLLNTISNQ